MYEFSSHHALTALHERAGPAPGIPVIPGIPAMTDLPGESGMPGIPLLTGITDKQNQNERLFSLLSYIIDHCNHKSSIHDDQKIQKYTFIIHET